MNDSTILGSRISLLLLGRQRNLFVAIQLRRHVIEHHILGAPQYELSHFLSNCAGMHAWAKVTFVQKIEDPN